MARKKKTSRGSRRILDQQIADIAAQIASIKARAATQDKFDPKVGKAERKRLGLSDLVGTLRETGLES